MVRSTSPSSIHAAVLVGDARPVRADVVDASLGGTHAGTYSSTAAISRGPGLIDSWVHNADVGRTATAVSQGARLVDAGVDRTATVESRCAGWSVDRKIRALNAREPDGLLARLCAGMNGGEARQLGAALQQGDAAALGLLKETATDLAFGLSHVTHLLHPQVIVLGGGLSLLGEPLRAAVAEALPGFVMEAFQPGPDVRLARLGEDAVPTGALLLAADAAKSA